MANDRIAQTVIFRRLLTGQTSDLSTCAFRILFVAGAYSILAILVKWYFYRYQMWPAPLWLPSGVSLFAVLRFGPRSSLGVFLGSVLTDVFGFGESVGLALVVSAGNALAPVMAVAVLRDRLRKSVALSSVADAFFFGLGTLVFGASSALIGATAIWFTQEAPIAALPSRLLDWGISDAGAAMLLTPFLLLARHQPVVLPSAASGIIELLATLGGCAATVVYLIATHGSATNAGASFLILLPLLWLAIRFSLSVAYPAFVAVMTVVVAATLAGYGPFAGSEASAASFVFAQMAIGFGAAILLLGGSSREQQAAESALRTLNLELEARVEQRTAQLKESQGQLERAALYDPLTGLPNRRLLEEQFSFCESTARRKNHSFGVLLIDLDFFKEINDNFGHDAGDAFLKETGQRLKRSVRDCDVVARIGGDEFVILLPETSDKARIDSICDRIIQMLSTPVSFNGNDFVSSATIGAALCPDHGITWQLVYKAADVALYQAKRTGRRSWRWHADESFVQGAPASQSVTHY